MSVGRSAVGLLLGLAATLVVIFGFIVLRVAIYPLPGTDVGVADPALAALLRKVDYWNQPTSFHMLGLVSWIIAAFGGAWVASTIANRAAVVHGMVVTIYIVYYGWRNIFPLWPERLRVWGSVLLILVVIAGYLGTRHTRSLVVRYEEVQSNTSPDQKD